LKAFWKVFNMDAGQFDKLTAYAAVNTMRLDDMRPHLFRTHDGGKTWKEIVNGIPDGAATSTIREDPKRKGLLYAGTENQVYFSIDDGDHWESLRLNAPASSFRDVQIKGDDLVAATHGRGFLILDNLTPLRQLAAKTAAEPLHLYAPQTAMRIRGDMNPPTPWPPDMATGQNPPDGAMIDYYVGANFTGVLTLEVTDSKGEVIARINSTDPVPPLDPRYPDPVLWARPPRVLLTTAGHHRFLWDLRYPAVPGMSTGPSADEAVPGDTPAISSSPWVMPGTYTVKLIAGGKTLSEPMKVVMDPRVKTSQADLEAQFKISMDAYKATLQATAAIHEITVLREQLAQKAGQAPVDSATDPLEAKLTAIAGPAAGRGGRGGGGGGGRRGGGEAGAPNLNTLRTQLARTQHTMQASDVAPTTTQVEAAQSTIKPINDLLNQWATVKATDLKALNDSLKINNLPMLVMDTTFIDHNVEDQIELGDEE
jgi:hypothetical protein